MSDWLKKRMLRSGFISYTLIIQSRYVQSWPQVNKNISFCILIRGIYVGSWFFNFQESGRNRWRESSIFLVLTIIKEENSNLLHLIWYLPALIFSKFFGRWNENISWAQKLISFKLMEVTQPLMRGRHI